MPRVSNKCNQKEGKKVISSEKCIFITRIVKAKNYENRILKRLLYVPQKNSYVAISKVYAIFFNILDEKSK